MNIVKKIGVLTLVLGLMTGITQAATREKPDATLRLSGGSFAAGIGFSWGGGTLTYKGKEYPVKVNGLSIGKVGMTGMTASGQVFNLKHLNDFDGNYTGAGAGATLAGGRTAITISNQHNVRILLSSTNRGFDLTVGGGGAEFKIKK